ncbi:UDP-2,4-diacetamido-2,4,6-trideoxy-beta-L-altropyranose hydrolase [Halobacillus litoralis]|uniref:UDP-2,4-diacetamido-2,4, 6-trideoxy-beta-L-altropyranose hydrolase n=1 Tax=Halobacillus litoralis TaxID=45668 RepID=UPI00136A1BDD|nr:UDP-2,4-diacetamido-2,4,6-trideoxy-beta-L-altropyranose hydrolase [Halobacillus litoralis]MYL37508.1 UDP-2,4-diacetamido-2,4,6-trideoxy-beta-L-altropyranose hydrolase [Halobacillus litoralis]
MRAAVRADASVQWGTGHMMRCLTLAEELRDRGSEVFFICRSCPEGLRKMAEHRSFPVHLLEDDGEFSFTKDAEQTKELLQSLPPVDWLIVDHYQLDARWEKILKPLVKRLMVIDDLADRPHLCDVLLDQNAYTNLHERYNQWVPPSAVQLLGPEYLLLRKEFLQAGQRRRSMIRHLLISFGGTDPSGQTMKAMEAVQHLTALTVTIVIGGANEKRQTIQQYASRFPHMTLHVQTSHMAQLMEKADLVIGAGGSSIWECCYMNLPVVVIQTAANQRETIDALKKKQAIRYVGKAEEVHVDRLRAAVETLVQHPDAAREMADRFSRIMGAYRPGRAADCLLNWNNSPESSGGKKG